jgi:nucleoside-diphosphate-sugar epimerase
VRILVAGGAGFVGNHFCRRLIDEGHAVTCVDNLVTGRRSNIDDLLGRAGFTFIDMDISALDPSALVPEAPEVIVHLASPASPSDFSRIPLEIMAVNSLGTWRLLELAQAVGAALVYASTSEAYGDPLIHPQPETYWGNVDPVGPRSCYDESKRFGEALVTAFRGNRGVRAAIVRIFNTYGPAMRLDDGRVIPAFVDAILEKRPLPVQGDGTQTRSFQYVSDLVDGLRLVALDPDLDGLLLNIGNPDEMSVEALATRLLDIAGSSQDIAYTPARSGDPQRRCPDITRMHERYGWQPLVSLDEGLRRTLDWFVNTRVNHAVPAGGHR